jgi:uncharacterized repeat protein (TIGR01451 family)
VLDKVSAPNPVVQGGSLSYTIRLVNTGAPASGVTLTDLLPSGVSFLSASPPAGWTCTNQANQVICSGGVANTGISSFTIVVNVTGCQPPLVNTVSVSPSSLVLAGNPSTVTNTTAEVCASDLPTPTPTGGTVGPRTLFINKTAQPNPVNVGNVLTYDLQVINVGTSTQGIVVTDTLPSGVTFLNPSTPVGWTCTNERSQVTCSGGTVPVGVPVTFHIRVRVDDCLAAKTNTATVAQNGVLAGTASTVTAVLCPTPTVTATTTRS